MKIILLALLFLLSGCDELDKLTQFDMEYNETVVIPSSTGINLPFNLFTPDIESNSESTFEINNTRKDLIEEIILKKMHLTLTSPSNSDFSFLESIEIFMSAEGLDEIKIAWKDTISSNGGNQIELETVSFDLKDYIKKEEFKLRLNTVTDELVTSDHSINVYSLFFVDAKILGQ